MRSTKPGLSTAKYLQLDDFSYTSTLPRYALAKVQRQVPGIPNATSFAARHAIQTTITRLKNQFWDSIQVRCGLIRFFTVENISACQYWDNFVFLAQDARRDNIERRSFGPAVRGWTQQDLNEWDCGYRNNTLNVAIHLRRGDLFASDEQRDQDRLVSMDYYRNFLAKLAAAYKVRAQIAQIIVMAFHCCNACLPQSSLTSLFIV